MPKREKPCNCDHAATVERLREWLRGFVKDNEFRTGDYAQGGCRMAECVLSLLTPPAKKTTPI